MVPGIRGGRGRGGMGRGRGGAGRGNAQAVDADAAAASDDDDGGGGGGGGAGPDAAVPSGQPSVQQQRAMRQPLQQMLQEDFRSGQGVPPSLAALKGDFLSTVVLHQQQSHADFTELGKAALTRQRHRRELLRMVTQFPSELHQLPLAEALVRWYGQRFEDANGRWSWSTLHREMANAAGALADLPVYTNKPLGVSLGDSPAWAEAMRYAEQKAKETQPFNQPAALVAEIFQAVDKEASPRIKAVLILTWLTGGRVGDVLALQREDVDLKNSAAAGATAGGAAAAAAGTAATSTSRSRRRTASSSATTAASPDPAAAPPPSAGAAAPGHNLTVSFRRGKGVKLSRPYTVHTSCPAAWVETLRTFLAGFTKDTDRLFGAPSLSNTLRTGLVVNEALRAVNPVLSQRAIRRGSLQAMAAAGTDFETLRTFSGHTSDETLKRYLDWGRKAGLMAERGAAAARHLASSQL